MQCTLQNNKLFIIIDTYGGELQWLESKKNGHNYLWQGNPKTNERKAINIFPYVARLTEGKYKLFGKTYAMQPHGFISEVDMKIEKQTDTELVLSFAANEETKKCYPYEFKYYIEYMLSDNKIYITYRVQNCDNKMMYFGIGGHPGFCVPLNPKLKFEDYYLEFSDKKVPYRVGMSDTCYVKGENKVFELEEGKYIPLKHALFDKDAIILTEMSKAVKLGSDKDTMSITVEYPNMDYLGIWHWPKTESNFVCIEPWSSLPSRQDMIEDFEKQENLIKLDKSGLYKNTWCVKIE